MTSAATKPEIVIAKSGRKLSLVYRTRGVHFATYAELREGRTVVACTPDCPYGFRAAARADALAKAEEL